MGNNSLLPPMQEGFVKLADLQGKNLEIIDRRQAYSQRNQSHFDVWLVRHDGILMETIPTNSLATRYQAWQSDHKGEVLKGRLVGTPNMRGTYDYDVVPWEEEDEEEENGQVPF